jgi:putative transposase
VLRRQVQVLERQIKRVRWTPGDRMFLAALRNRLPRSAWAGLLIQPETVLGWHRELVGPRATEVVLLEAPSQTRCVRPTPLTSRVMYFESPEELPRRAAAS